ncbi:response regulator [Albidovulum sp.]|uniref:response regulator n=1 Tax=Albidovulum sp. TaxID=1872424 RepID=UPI00352700C5
MADDADWQEEFLRQKARLEADFVSRHIGVLLASAISLTALPFWFVFLTYLTIVGTEILARRTFVRFEREPSRSLRRRSLLYSGLGLAVFVLGPVIVATNRDPMMEFIGLLALMAAMLHVTSVRSVHLPMGIVTAIPPVLGIFCVPLYRIYREGFDLAGGISLFAAAVLVGYFFAAIRASHRVHSDLVASSGQIRAASQAKSRFLAAMSHEVRTPLNAIVGNAQVLGNRLPDPALGAHVEAIERAARGLEVLIEDVVDLSSVAEGKLRFNPVTVSVRGEMEALRQIRLSSVGAIAPEIGVEVAETVPEFGQFDPLLLRKCIGHLCEISIAEQPEDTPPRLQIRCALAPLREDRIRITITGAGPAPTGSRITPFLPGQPSDSLTLSVVHGVAGVMGAKAAALRAPDETLVMRLEFPFVPVPEPPDSGAESVYGRLRVLVVDDIATNRFVVVQMLRSLRIEAYEAESGQSALDMLAAREFDLVLLDMNMPDIDGEATFSAIRSSGMPWAKIPVVALTADSVTYRRDHFIGIGMNGYLSKPVDRRLLWVEILAAAPPPPPL